MKYTSSLAVLALLGKVSADDTFSQIESPEFYQSQVLKQIEYKPTLKQADDFEEKQIENQFKEKFGVNKDLEMNAQVQKALDDKVFQSMQQQQNRKDNRQNYNNKRDFFRHGGMMQKSSKTTPDQYDEEYYGKIYPTASHMQTGHHHHHKHHHHEQPVDENTYGEEYYGKIYPQNEYKVQNDQDSENLLMEQMNMGSTLNNVVVLWRKQDDNTNKNMFQKNSQAKDAFDGDHDTASPYDNGANINGGHNPMFKKLDSTETIGESLHAYAKRVKKDMENKDAAEEKKKSGVPEEPGAVAEAKDKAGANTAMEPAAPAGEEEAKAVAETVKEAAVQLKSSSNITANLTANVTTANITSSARGNATFFSKITANKSANSTANQTGNKTAANLTGNATASLVANSSQNGSGSVIANNSSNASSANATKLAANASANNSANATKLVQGNATKATVNLTSNSTTILKGNLTANATGNLTANITKANQTGNNTK